MNDSVKQDTPALVVFGQTDKNGRHAAWFNAAESADARKAASVRSLAVIEPIPDELTAFLPKIARGRFVMGQISMSKADPGAYGKLLESLAAAKAAKEVNDGSEKQIDRLPADPELTPKVSAVPTTVELWRRLKVGDTVLASYEGWWKARVMAVHGETVRVAWLDGGDNDEFDDVPRSGIALLFPKA